MRRLLAVVLVMAGLSLGGWALLDDTGDDVGALTIGAPTTGDGAESPSGTEAPRTDADQSTASAGGPAADPTSDPDGDTSTAAGPTPAASPIAGRSGRIGDVVAAPAATPTGMTMPGLGIDARIVPVGVDPDGLMTVPEDVATVGWYRFGSAPGSEAGTTVLAGHVDDRVQGRGAFFDLRAAQVGDELTITDETGTTSAWRVTGRRTFEKDSLPVEDLYRRTGPPRLVLITCGGEFDRAARSYEANVVVEAEPVP